MPHLSCGKWFPSGMHPWNFLSVCIQGPAIGGGLGLAMVADIRIAAPEVLKRDTDHVPTPMEAPSALLAGRVSL